MVILETRCSDSGIDRRKNRRLHSEPGGTIACTRTARFSQPILIPEVRICSLLTSITHICRSYRGCKSLRLNVKIGWVGSTSRFLRTRVMFQDTGWNHFTNGLSTAHTVLNILLHASDCEVTVPKTDFGILSYYQRNSGTLRLYECSHIQ